MPDNRIRLKQLEKSEISGFIRTVSSGERGLAGPTGPVGGVGPSGATGVQGAIGPSGATGAQGPQGIAGPTGPQASPSGANKLLQFNKSGVFGGTSGFYYDSGTQRLGAGISSPSQMVDVSENIGVSGSLIGPHSHYTVAVASNKFYIRDVPSGSIYPTINNKQPTIYLHRGHTYSFDLSDVTNSGHTFYIGTSGVTGAPPSTTFYSGVYNNGASYTTSEKKLTFRVPQKAPTGLFYFCGNHTGMGGQIVILDKSAGGGGGGGSDNLGNHTATQTLNMASKSITGVGLISGQSGLFKEDLRTLGDVQVSKSVHIKSQKSNGVSTVLFVDSTQDDLIIRKVGTSNHSLVVDGDNKHVGVNWQSGTMPSHDLSVSGDQGIIAYHSDSKGKGTLEHSTSKGTNLRLYNQDGLAKVYISPNATTWLKGGGLAVGENVSTSTSYKFDVAGTAHIEEDLTIKTNLLPETSGSSNLGSTTKYLDKVYVNTGIFNSGVIIENPPAPTQSTDAGVKGQISWDSDYLYICVDAGSWGRVALDTMW